MSADPAGLLDGAGVYSYVKGNPVRFKDLSGREAHENAEPRLPVPAPAAIWAYPTPSPPPRLQKNERPAPTPKPAPLTRPEEEKEAQPVSVLIAAHKTADPRSTDAVTAQKMKMTVDDVRRLRKNEDANFTNRAEFLKRRLVAEGSDEERVMVHSVERGEEFVRVLEDASKKGPIKHLVVFGHSGPTAVYMREGAGFYRNEGDIKDADRKQGLAFLSTIQQKVKEGKIKFAENAIVIFAGCKAAGSETPEAFSIGAEFARSFGVTTVGSLGGSDQSKIGQDLFSEYSTFGWTRFERKGEDVVSSPAAIEKDEQDSRGPKFLRPSQYILKRK